jgi:hypothetical protein
MQEVSKMDSRTFTIYSIGVFFTIIILMTLDPAILRKTYYNKETYILKNNLYTYGNTIPKGDLQEYTIWTGFQYHVLTAIIIAITWSLINFFTPGLNKMLIAHVNK